MPTILAVIVIFGGGFAAGWAQGSKDGFKQAVDQLDRIVGLVGRRQK